VKLVVDDRDKKVECCRVALSPCDEESRDIGWRGCDGRILLLESGPDSSIIRVARALYSEFQPFDWRTLVPPRSER
jgi:hypothetical protein